MKSCTSLQHRSFRILMWKKIRFSLSIMVVLSLLATSSPISVFRDLFVSEVHAVETPLEAYTITNIINQNPKEQYIAGDTVTILFTFSKAFSSVAFLTAEVYVVNSGVEYLKFVYLDTIDRLTWSLKYKITNETEPGNFFVQRINANDVGFSKSFGSNQLYPNSTVDLSPSSFTVTGTSGDHTPPILNSLTINSNQIAAFEKVVFNLDILDPSQPVSTEIYYKMGDTSKIKLVAACSQSMIECGYSIKEYDPSGLWQVAYVVLFDDAMKQNRVTLYNAVLYPNAENKMNFESASFTVVGTQTDITAPVLNGVTLSSKLFHLNETLLFEVNAIDDVSGCSNIGLTFINRDNGSTYSAITNGLTLKGEYNFLRTFAIAGHYSIQRVEVKDMAQNVVIHYNKDLFTTDGIGVGNELTDFSMYDFVILETSITDVSSWLTDVFASKTDVFFGQEVQFSFQAIGELAQTDYIRIVYDKKGVGAQADEFETNQYLELYNLGDGKFSGDFRYMLNILGYCRPMLLKYWINGVEKRIYDQQNIQGLLVADLSKFGLTINYQSIEDITPPILDSFTIALHEPKIYDTVPLNIKGHDDESGVYQYAVRFRVNGIARDENIFLFVCEECGEEQNFGFEVGPFDYNGLWEVDYLYIASKTLSKRYFNSKFYPDETNVFDFSQAYFTISGAIEDHEPAEMNSIQMNVNSGYPGDTIEFLANVSDDVSGVASMSVEYQNENEDILNFNFELTNETTAFSTFTISEYTRPGLWKPVAIYMNDLAGNRSLYANTNAYSNICDYNYNARCVDLSDFNLQVLGDLSDTEGPHIVSLTSEFSNYVNRGNANVKVQVEDQNRIKEIKLEYSTPFGIRSFNAAMYTQVGNSFDVPISIPTLNSLGNWMLTRVLLTDIYGNKTIYIDSPIVDLAQHKMPLNLGDFTVIGKETQPTVEKIDTDLEIATTGDVVKVVLDLKDDIIKPDTIEAKLTAADLSSRTLMLTKQSDDTYIGIFLVGMYTSNGLWTVESLQYTDRYGLPNEINSILWNPGGINAQDLSAANFAVNGTSTDILAPEITNVAIEKASGNRLIRSDKRGYSMNLLNNSLKIVNTIQLTSSINIFTTNDRIKFLVEASDEISGLNSLFVTYQIFRKTVSFTIPMTLNELGKYEGEITIKDYFPQGNWSLVYFEASDGAGNKFIKNKEEIETNGHLIGLNRLQFFVNNPNEDKTAPVLSDLSLNKKSLKDGETLIITAQASDSHAGIASFEISLMPYYYNEESMTKKLTMYHMDDRSYQGEMKITENVIGSKWGIKDIIITDRASNVFEQHNTYMYSDYITNKKVMTEFDFIIDYFVNVELINSPSKLTYRIGEAIDLTGIEVSGYSTDGTISEVNITKDMVWNFDTTHETEEQQVYVFIDETYVTFNIKVINQTDITPPVITVEDYITGWTNQSILVKASVNEGSLNETEHTFHENGSFEFVATDESGNVSRQSVTITNIDKTKPTIFVAQNLKFTLNGNVTIPYINFDLDSGLVGASNGAVEIDTTKVGTYTIDITATDLAGNIQIEKVSYVIVYNFEGFAQPINANGTSIIKAGSTLPVKFKLSDVSGQNQGDAIASIIVTRLNSYVEGAVNEVIVNTTASATEFFRYDIFNQQYILNFSTKELVAGRYRLSVNLNDGECYSVEIGLKK